MKISFIVPAHNEEGSLPTCLEAIHAEILRSACDAEIIVVNNASTDRTGEVARAFEGVVVVDEPQKGLARARHSGFLRSQGYLIANIDADTRMPPGWVPKVLAAFEHDEKLIALSGPFTYYDLPFFARNLWHVFYFFGYLMYLINRFVLRVGAMIQGGNFVIRRDALEKIGGYDTSITFYGEDVDLARRLYPIGKIRWTFGLPMYASGRRISGEGILKVALKYGVNYFSTIFIGKPVTKTHVDFRQNDTKTVNFSVPYRVRKARG